MQLQTINLICDTNLKILALVFDVRHRFDNAFSTNSLISFSENFAAKQAFNRVDCSANSDAIFSGVIRGSFFWIDGSIFPVSFADLFFLNPPELCDVCVFPSDPLCVDDPSDGSIIDRLPSWLF